MNADINRHSEVQSRDQVVNYMLEFALILKNGKKLFLLCRWLLPWHFIFLALLYLIFIQRHLGFCHHNKANLAQWQCWRRLLVRLMPILVVLSG